MHESQGRAEEALESYRKAAEADPSYGEAHIAAGAVHESQGRAEEALVCYRKAAEADIASGAPGGGQGGAAESVQGRSGAADPAGAGDTAGRALDRLHKKQGRLRVSV